MSAREVAAAGTLRHVAAGRTAARALISQSFTFYLMQWPCSLHVIACQASAGWHPQPPYGGQGARCRLDAPLFHPAPHLPSPLLSRAWHCGIRACLYAVIVMIVVVVMTTRLGLHPHPSLCTGGKIKVSRGACARAAHSHSDRSWVAAMINMTHHHCASGARSSTRSRPCAMSRA